MNDVILVYSKFSKKSNFNISFDVVLHENKLYGGINLFKNFINYINNDKSVSALKFNSFKEAEQYYNNFPI